VTDKARACCQHAFGHHRRSAGHQRLAGAGFPDFGNVRRGLYFAAPPRPYGQTHAGLYRPREVHPTPDGSRSSCRPIYTFTAACRRAHVSAQWNTVGLNPITATDTANASITGTESGSNVVAAPDGRHLRSLDGRPRSASCLNVDASESGLARDYCLSLTVSTGEMALRVQEPFRALRGPKVVQCYDPRHEYPQPDRTDPNSQVAPQRRRSVTLTTTLHAKRSRMLRISPRSMSAHHRNVPRIAITPVIRNGIQFAGFKVGMELRSTTGKLQPFRHVVVFRTSGQ